MAAKKKASTTKAAAPRRAPEGATVADVMTQVVVTLGPEATIQEAIDLFAQRNISGAPVVSKDGAVLGVVSATDLLREKSSEGSPERETAYYLEDELSGSVKAVPDRVGRRTVLDIATKRVVSIDEGAPLPEAARVLFDLGIRRLVVTRRRRFAGILSATDIVKWVAHSAPGTGL